MQPSSFDSYFIPPTTSTNPATIAKAAQKPIRVLVRNTGAVLIFLSHVTENLAQPGAPSTAAYRLASGAEDIFVLAPKQSLYAIGVAAGGIASVAISEALPVDGQGMQGE